MNSKIIVCCSGGVDSTVLAFLLQDELRLINSEHSLHVIIVDHKLRENSTEHAMKTKGYLEENGFHNVNILTWKHDNITTAIEEKARNARYDLIEEYCSKNDINIAFLGHNLDDQIETFLMRLERGAGLLGLSCMEEMSIRNNLFCIRPLLNIKKCDIIEYAQQNNIKWIEDESNSNTQYKRNEIRKILSEISKNNKNILYDNLTNTISAIKNDLEIIQKHTVQLFQKYCIYNDESNIITMKIDALNDIFVAEYYRLFSYICRQINPKWTARGYQIERAIDSIYQKHECKFSLGGIYIVIKNGIIQYQYSQ